ncbi:MAG: glycosyltransferase family 1 protein, partial [Candidatus Margulisiibacteriota bacterium]
MRIAINARLLNCPDFGIRTYLKCLTDHLVKNDGQNEYVLLSDKKQNKLWEHLYLAGIVNRGGFDVFHSPDHVLPLPRVKCKTVITVHDLSFVKHPELFGAGKRIYKRFIAPYSVKRADKVIAVSQNTKNDIVKLYKTDPAKITVVYNGAGNEFFKIGDKDVLDQARNKYGLTDNYILFVGTIEPRKNIINLIKAFKKSAATRGLVIVGKKGWLSDPIIREIKDHNGADKILWIDNVETKDLPALYSMASLLVYPSLYEGFGLPILEAMACGVPVITSNISSMPEVAGDAAVLIDPNGIDEIAKAIKDVLGDEHLRQSLISKGYQQAKKFSWEKCAK